MSAAKAKEREEGRRKYVLLYSFAAVKFLRLWYPG